MWPLTGAPGGQAAASLCSLGQGPPPCPLQSQWHLLGATLPGFAHASPGSFLFPANSSSLSWKCHFLRGAFPAFLNLICPHLDPLPLYLLLCIGRYIFITMCHCAHYLLGPRPMCRSPLDHDLRRAQIRARFVTSESLKPSMVLAHSRCSVNMS